MLVHNLSKYPVYCGTCVNPLPQKVVKLNKSAIIWYKDKAIAYWDGVVWRIRGHKDLTITLSDSLDIWDGRHK